MRVESTMINQSVRNILGLSATDGVSTEHIFYYYFGESSKFASLFIEHLGKDYCFFLKFLNTTFILQAYRLSITMLFDQSSLISNTVIKVSTDITKTNKAQHPIIVHLTSPSINSE